MMHSSDPVTGEDYKVRKFKCTTSFESENRFFYEGFTYYAREYLIDNKVTLIADNGSFNFTKELFEDIVRDWKVVLEEVKWASIK